jgi:hypothetical protein
MEKETLEEAAIKLFPRLINDPYNPTEDDNKENRDIWISGAKYQAERMYSEEEVIKLFKKIIKYDAKWQQELKQEIENL